jgi:molecular chaperone GrpE
MDEESQEPARPLPLPPPAWPPRDPSETVDVEFVVPADPYVSVDTDDGQVISEDLVNVDDVSVPIQVAAPAGPSDELIAIRELNDVLMKRLDDLQSAFDREVRAEATREKVVDRLHAELQEYKQDLLLNTLRPIFIDLIQLHDDIGKLVQAQEQADGHPSRLTDTMSGFQQGIEDILYRQGVEPFQHDSDVFDPRRQRAASTVVTDDPSIVKTVASRLRKGFQAGEKLIRPEIVTVYTLKK